MLSNKSEKRYFIKRLYFTLASYYFILASTILLAKILIKDEFHLSSWNSYKLKCKNFKKRKKSTIRKSKHLFISAKYEGWFQYASLQNLNTLIDQSRFFTANKTKFGAWTRYSLNFVYFILISLFQFRIFVLFLIQTSKKKVPKRLQFCLFVIHLCYEQLIDITMTYCFKN